MQLIRYTILLLLFIPYLEYLRGLEQHVNAIIHRPLHFLGMVGFTCVLYLFMTPEERKVDEAWKKKYPWLIWVVFGSIVLLMLSLWLIELLIDYRTGHIVSICIYALPIAVVLVLTVIGVIDRAAPS